MSLDLSSFKQTTGTTSDANKLDNAYDAIQAFVNALPVANIAGYPADVYKQILGDGSWGYPKLWQQGANYAPVAANTDLAAPTAQVHFVIPTVTNSTIRSIGAGVVSGQRLTLIHEGVVANRTTLLHNTAGGAGAKLWLRGQGNLLLHPDESIDFVYNATSGFWLELSRNFGPRACQARGAAGQTIANTTFTAIALDATDYDSETGAGSVMHDNAVNNYAIIVRESGIYEAIGWCYSGAANIGGASLLSLTKSGTVYGLSDAAHPTNGSGNVGQGRARVSAIAAMTPGDYFSLQYYQDSGGNINGVTAQLHVKKIG